MHICDKMEFQVIVGILVMTTIIPELSGLRVLGLFPHPGASHFHFFHPIMLGLAEAGHNVTVVSHFPDKNAPSNYKDLVIGGQDSLTNSVDLAWFANRFSFGHFLEFFLLHEWGRQSCETAVNSAAMDKLLKIKEKFDVIIVEQFNSDCMVGVAWKLKAPIIGLSSSAIMPYYYNRFGLAHSPSHVPVLFLGYSDKMTFSQRLSNWIAAHTFPLLRRFFMDRTDNIILKQKFGNDMPSVTEISTKISLLLVNTHYSLSGPRSLSPKIIEVGGVHIKEPKPIDEKLKSILNSSEHGVIYVSWGSMIRAETLPEEKREGLLNAFGSFKQTVLWKWENDTLANQPDNVHVYKWMPQREILCHPKVRVFITHGGLLGSSEAAYCGVPVVATPMYGDQFLNSAAFVDRGMGKVVKYEEISKETMEEAIKFALDPQTQENAKKVSYSYRNRPKPALETAVWWVEHVAATGGAPLTNCHSTFMTWYEYHLLDVYGVVAVCLITCVASWVWVIKRICGRSKPSTKNNKSTSDILSAHLYKYKNVLYIAFDE
ncbi:UDP-glycosyltransferase UGT5, partial [Pseudolycoriella hygida]